MFCTLREQHINKMYGVWDLHRANPLQAAWTTEASCIAFPWLPQWPVQSRDTKREKKRLTDSVSVCLRLKNRTAPRRTQTNGRKHYTPVITSISRQHTDIYGCVCAHVHIRGRLLNIHGTSEPGKQEKQQCSRMQERFKSECHIIILTDFI